MTLPAHQGRRTVVQLTSFALALLVLVLAARTASAAPVPNPAVPGAYAVKRFDYRAGKVALTIPQFKGRRASFTQPLRGSVTYPDSPGPFPVALMLHGRHETCVDRRGEGIIPVPGEENPACPDRKGHERWIKSYDGYRYMARRLASQGYVVISPDANLVASYELYRPGAGIKAREQVIGATFDLLRRWNLGTEPVVAEQKGVPKTELAGREDLSRIAMMGHSRGGEAATQFIAFNHKRSTIYPLGGVVAIGPTDIARTNPFRNGAANLAELLPGCDGDVSDLEGGHVFERVKNSHRADGASLYQWVVNGTNHDFFNTVWKFDDTKFGDASWLDSACGPKGSNSIRASRSGQRALGLSLVNGFIRRFAGGETSFDSTLERGELPDSVCAKTRPLPCDERVRPSYIAPQGQRLVLIGPGRKATRGIDHQGLDLSWCDPREPKYDRPIRGCPGGRGGGESMVNRSWTRQLLITWKKASTITKPVPEGNQDVSGFGNLTFRAVTTFSPRNPIAFNNRKVANLTQRMDVVLTDKDGNRATAPAEDYSTALQPTVGDRTRQLLLSDVSIPLSAFPGVDLTRIDSVGFAFGVRHRNHGQIQMSDVAFQNYASPAPSEVREPVRGPGTAVDAIRVSSPGGLPDGCESSASLDTGPVVSGGRLTVSGSVTADGCQGTRVQVAIFRKGDDGCRFASADGDFGLPLPCDRPFSLIAEMKDQGKWSLSIPFADDAPLPETSVAAISEIAP